MMIEGTKKQIECLQKSAEMARPVALLTLVVVVERKHTDFVHEACLKYLVSDCLSLLINLLTTLFFNPSASAFVFGN